MDLDLDYIETLVAVVDEGSFARAAKRLNRVQSAVTYNVRQLERRLSLTLFERQGRRSVLTDAGRIILEEGRILLARARRIERLARHFRHGFEPSLQLVIDGALPLESIMRALKSLADEGISTRIQLKVEFLGGVQFRFQGDDADMMLVKEYRASEQFVSRPLSEVTCALVASREHALARQTHATLSLPELHQHVELSVHDASESGLPDPHLFGGARVFYLSDFYSKKQAVLLGLGYGWMPLHLIRAELDAGALVELPFEAGSRFSFVPLLVYRSDRPLGRTGQRLVELLEAGVGAA